MINTYGVYCMVNKQCEGIYGKCLNIKIINNCNGACYFCIEKDGYKPKPVDVNTIITKANELKDYQTVLILGGEPFLYPHLIELVKGLKKKEIYITTNGTCFDQVDIVKLSKYISGINISIHSFLEDDIKIIMKKNIKFDELSRFIHVFQSNNVTVRLNTLLLKSGINSKEKMHQMIAFAKKMNIEWIRFSELQFENEGFVAAKDIFDGIYDDPYNCGCNQNLIIDGFNVTVRQSCGIVSLMKHFPDVLKKESTKLIA